MQPLLRRDEYRLLKPRKLCFLRDSQGIDIRDVSDWETNEGLYENLNYLFVAYSQEHFDHDSYEDMMALHAIAEEAARQAGLPAYWVASSCMSEDPNQVESDVSAFAFVPLPASTDDDRFTGSPMSFEGPNS